MFKNNGGMAEWFKAAVLKTVERKFRGFESYSLRHRKSQNGNKSIRIVNHLQITILLGEMTERLKVLAC